MCTVLPPPGGNPFAVNKYIIYITINVIMNTYAACNVTKSVRESRDGNCMFASTAALFNDDLQGELGQ
jgi:hypothetical protein